MMRKFCLVLLVVCLCVLSVGAAFAAMSDNVFFVLCAIGTPQKIQAAIKAGANVHARNENGWTPLMFAAGGNSNPEVIIALIKSGADVHAKNINGTTVLETAALNETAAKKKIIAILEEHMRGQPKAEQGKSTKPTDDEFFELCMNGTPQQVQAAIKAGANVNARNYSDASPPMFAALENSNPEVITVLAKAGANVNVRYFNGLATPLIWAAMGTSNPEVIIALIRSGADVHAKNIDGATPLGLAVVTNSNPEVITALIKYGADVNAKSEDGRTPLMFAAVLNSNPEVITALIKSGADVHVKNIDGATALDVAAHNKTAAKNKIIAILEEHTQRQPKAEQGEKLNQQMKNSLNCAGLGLCNKLKPQSRRGRISTREITAARHPSCSRHWKTPIPKL